jgi:CBS-domain-containing membrane protein
MIRHILVVMDGSAASAHAFDMALDMAVKNRAMLSALSVIEHLPAYAASVGEVQEALLEAEEFFHDIHRQATAKAQSVGIALESHVGPGHPVQKIIHEARRLGCDLIVLALAGHGSQWGTIGHGAVEKVAEGAHCSVMVVRDKGKSVFVSEVMSRDVASVRTDTPITQVTELLIQRGVKAVPVLNLGERVVGIITGGDLLERGGMQLRLSLQQALGDEVIGQQLKALDASGKVAADIMTAPAECIGVNATITTAARIMAAKRLKRLPITDPEGNLVGIVSRADVLKAMAGVTTTPDAAVAVPHNGMNHVSDLMLQAVPSVAPEATADEVLSRLLSSPLRRVVVVDGERKPVGVITDGDLLARVTPAARRGLLQVLASALPFLAAGETGSTLDLLKHYSAAEVMSQPALTVREDATLADTVRLMFERRVKRLPVVDAQGRLAGIVDRQSILKAMAP